MIGRYPQRHSGVPKNHWSRITGSTGSPDPTSILSEAAVPQLSTRTPRVPSPGGPHGRVGRSVARLLIAASSSCSWERGHVRSPGARLEPRRCHLLLRLLVVESGDPLPDSCHCIMLLEVESVRTPEAHVEPRRSPPLPRQPRGDRRADGRGRPRSLCTKPRFEH